MSSAVLKIIPANTDSIPGKNKQEQAKDFLTNIFKEEQIGITITDSVEFVDQGENFDSVSCNLCGESMDIEEWQHAMDKAYEKRFIDLDFITSCCHRKTSLNDLAYHSPAGFAKFVIAIADARRELSIEEISILQEILGSKLRSIWAHY